MHNFKLIENKFDKDKINKHGNKYVIGNGLYGYRGTLDEYTKKELVDLTCAGIYYKYQDKWVEPVNMYNPLYIYIEVDNTKIDYQTCEIIDHYQELNLKDATFKRETTFLYKDTKIKIESIRFLSHDNLNIIGQKYSVSTSSKLNLKIYSGFDLNIWDLNGPHLKIENKKYDNDKLKINVKTLEKNISLGAIISEKVNRKVLKNIINNENFFGNSYEVFDSVSKFTITKIISLKNAEIDAIDYEKYFNKHLLCINKKWEKSDIKIIGDDLAQLGIRLSMYHLMIIAPQKTDSSISARGLSGQVYKGACFWDTEMFMLDYYLLTNVASAKNIIKYRINSLDESIKKAKELGYKGAYYAWEATLNGKEACTLYNIQDSITKRNMRTYFMDKQIHISADVVYGIDKYIKYTNDYSILFEGGINVILEVCNFYFDYMYYHENSNKYHILDVTGPDEYHERVNNNAFTNKMVEYCFETLIKYIKYIKKNAYDIYITLAIDDVLKRAKKVKGNIYVPNTLNGVIEQFSGYFKLKDIKLDELLKQKLTPNEYLGGENGLASSTKIIKQADVITMLYMFRDDYTKEEMKINFDYYHEKTEHGSSLSASMYGIIASLIDEKEKAYQYFLDSSLIDYYSKGKEYAGLTYIDGTHPASSGGAYMIVLYGFCKMKIKNNKLIFEPNLPKNIKKIELNIEYLNEIYKVEVEKEKVLICKKQ